MAEQRTREILDKMAADEEAMAHRKNRREKQDADRARRAALLEQASAQLVTAPQPSDGKRRQSRKGKQASGAPSQPPKPAGRGQLRTQVAAAVSAPQVRNAAGDSLGLTRQPNDADLYEPDDPKDTSCRIL